MIEMMIGIALLALLLGAQMELMGSSQALRRQKEMLMATRQAEKQLQRLQAVPFDQLPPQVLKPDSQGWLQLGQPDFDPHSLQLKPLEGSLADLKIEKLEKTSGRIKVGSQLAGQLLSLNYTCFLSDRGETHRVGPSGQLRLDNGPAVRIEAILTAQGESLRPFTDWNLGPKGDLQLGPSAAGKVLMIDYRGAQRSNLLSGTFVDDRLRPQEAPSNLKLLRLQENYAGHGRVTVSTLRVAP
ncbi:hypothetical protein JST97_11515 [bacterium]|nr:hypothetical protein [bacterium]